MAWLFGKKSPKPHNNATPSYATVYATTTSIGAGSFYSPRSSVNALQGFHQSQTASSSAMQSEHDRLAATESLISYDAASSTRGHGTSPSGTMKITIKPNVPCPGFPSGGTIEIFYDLPSGTQLRFHPHPGVAHSGARRQTYLPNTAEGRCLLTRLRYAFRHGHTFKVGKSLTSGLDHQITWSTIPQRTSLNGGPFGFPSKDYLLQANLELDRLGIPSTDACLHGAAHAHSITVTTNTTTTNGNDFTIKKQTITYQAPTSFNTSKSSTDALTPYRIPPSPSQRNAPSVLNLPDIAKLSLPKGYNASSTPSLQPLSCAGSNLGHAAHNTSTDRTDRECAICLDPLTEGSLTQIKSCKHVFHESCIQDSLQHVFKCPVCRQSVGEPQGKSPSGTMCIDILDVQCPGFLCDKTISIIYEIPSGKQHTYHDHPGQRYEGTSRVAYLPSSIDGRKLLYRLQYAWTHGLIFRIGNSLTTGNQNVTTWASIHHKTSLHGGPHGFPDANYIANCNGSLDALGVPAAESCV